MVRRPLGAEWRDEAVRLVDHDPSWPDAYREEAAALENAIGPWVTGGIHHVGSTAVPGLSAKPVIDVLVGVESLEASRPCIELLEPLQYLYSPYRAEVMHWLCKPDPSRRTHHLHLVPTGSPRFVEELAFRDYLRAHAEHARAYEALKRDLAGRFRHDRGGYTEGKASFVRELTERAVAWSAQRATTTRDGAE